MEEFRKSINSILYERVSSPFLGTITLTWLIWNWKIVYLTFFISESKISLSKIDHILQNYSDSWTLVYGPLISTVILLTLVPFISNGAYWLSMLFKKWRVDKKNEIERKQQLTIEQSISLREEIRNQEDRFEKLLANKEQEIKFLKAELTELRKSNNNPLPKETMTNDTETKIEIDEKALREEFEVFKNNKRMYGDFPKVVSLIQKGINLKQATYPPETTTIGFLEANEIISNDGKGQLSWTEKGKYFYREYINGTSK